MQPQHLGDWARKTAVSSRSGLLARSCLKEVGGWGWGAKNGKTDQQGRLTKKKEWLKIRHEILEHTNSTEIESIFGDYCEKLYTRKFGGNRRN